MVAVADSGIAQLALACEERVTGALLGQPASAVTSFAFVVAGLAILAGLPRARVRVPRPRYGSQASPRRRYGPQASPRRRYGPQASPRRRYGPQASPRRFWYGWQASPRRFWHGWQASPLRFWYGSQASPYGLLVALVGVGSVIQHGPHPPWQAYAHDLSLGAVLAYVAVDAARDLSGRRLPAWWWLAPTVALVPLIAIGPGASAAAQVTLAVLAIGLGLLRAAARPALRRTLLVALAVLAAGAAVGALGDRTTLCQPESLLQGHAVWHVLAALALWLLTPAIARHRTPDRGDHGVLARPAGQYSWKTP